MAPTRRATKAKRPSDNLSLRRLPLASLRGFVATAEHLSFRQAAELLGVSVGAVSMQIRALEEYLRAPLFRRNGHHVELTPDGQTLLPRVRSALEDLQLAIDAMRAERRSGPITVSMLSSFLQHWFLPRLPDFQARHPDIDLRIETSRALADFVRSGVQAAIRFGDGNWPRLHTQKLFDDWLVPLCTPAMLRKLGPIEHPRDLARYRLINVSSEPWSSWPSGKSIEEWANNGATLDDSASAVSAAVAGQGLLLGRWSLAAAEVQSGRLAIASHVIVRFERAYYFVCPPAYLSMEKIAAFGEWLLAQARAFPMPEAVIAAANGRKGRSRAGNKSTIAKLGR